MPQSTCRNRIRKIDDMIKNSSVVENREYTQNLNSNKIRTYIAAVFNYYILSIIKIFAHSIIQ